MTLHANQPNPLPTPSPSPAPPPFPSPPPSPAPLSFPPPPTPLFNQHWQIAVIASLLLLLSIPLGLLMWRYVKYLSSTPSSDDVPHSESDQVMLCKQHSNEMPLFNSSSSGSISSTLFSSLFAMPPSPSSQHALPNQQWLPNDGYRYLE